MDATRLTDSVCYHGEGPCWSEVWGELKWVDMLAGDVLGLQADGGIRRTHVGTVAAVVRPRAGGGAVIGVERGFALARRTDLTDVAELPPVWRDAGIRMNEGNCDPAGRFYCGTMAYAKTPGAATVYLLDPLADPADPARWQVSTAFGDATISNGLGWSPDGTRAYYVDTPTGRVDVFDWDSTDGLTDRRPFVTVDEHLGHPDGLTVDAEGGVWVALNGGGAVHRYDAAGRLSERVTVPPRQVTACAFWGPELDRLVITTSREDLPDGAQPEAGSLYEVVPGVRGLEPLAFAG